MISKTEEANDVASDLSKQPIVFVYKETPKVEMIKRICPKCGGGNIHKVKSKTLKQRGHSKLQFVPAHFACNKCKETFLQPKEVTKVITRLKILPGDLQKIANRKKKTQF